MCKSDISCLKWKFSILKSGLILKFPIPDLYVLLGEEELEYLLIKEYGRKHELGQKTTYLDMTQKICGDLLHACPGAKMLTLDDEVMILAPVFSFIIHLLVLSIGQNFMVDHRF